MTRKSDRQNKGKLPSYLEQFALDQDESDDSSEELNATIVGNSDKMDDAELKNLLTNLTDQLKEMQTAMKTKTDEMQSKMEEENKELHSKLETTRMELQAVKQNMNVSIPGCSNLTVNPTNTSTNDISSITSSSSTHPTTTTSTVISTNTSTSSTNSNATPLLPTALATGQNSFPEFSQQSTSTAMFPRQPQNQFYPRKQLVALPKFDGNPCEWPMFLAEYRRTTDEYHYSSLENTSRLNDCLKGKARELVQWLLIHSNMSEKVIERLQTRFGRTDLLVDAQLCMLREIPKINEARLEQIVPFADKVVNFAHFMMSSECVHQLSNPTLLNELIVKLPMATRITWSMHSSTLQGHPTILDFSEWIERLADNIDRVPTGNAAPMQLSSEKRIPAKKANIMHASSVPEIKTKCYKCKGEHFITICEEFKDLSSDDRWAFVKERRLCFCCLKYGHSTGQCRKRKSCGQDGCTRVHNRLLHNNHEQESQRPASSTTSVSCNAISKNIQPRVLFKIVPVKLYGNDGAVIQTHAFIDEGSSTSLINKDLIVKLGLKGPKRQLELQWFGNQKSVEESQAVTLKISGVHTASEMFELNDVCAVQNLCLPTQTLHVNQLHSKFQGLRNLPIVSYQDAKPEILIGLDYCHLGISRRKIANDYNGLIVSECPLGWIVYGKVNDEETTSTARLCHINEKTQEPIDKIDAIVKDYFTLENFGVQPTNKTIDSTDDIRAKEILHSTTKRIGDRFESGLLWRSDHVQLPDSFSMAMKRLVTVENKMKKDPVYSAKYHETIDDYVKKGYAKKLTPEEVAVVTSRTWYLPHFGVLNPNKPKKFRLVFDAAAAVEGTSLNSSLMSGPDLNQPLLSVLCKFRERKIGVCADIREMYHQIKICDVDQDSQRFLWRNPSTQSVEVFKMLVMTFGSTSSPSTAQHVKNHNALEFNNSHPAAVQAILYRHYVDDYVHSFDDESQAIETTSDVKRIHKAGGFVLRGFISNSEHVAQALNDDDFRQQLDVNMNIDGEQTCDKILGMTWNTSQDEFRFQLKFNRICPDVIACKRRPTKREFLSIVMSVYDPFGLLANFLIHMKVLLQSVWRSGIEWDEPLPSHLHERWCAWKSELEEVKCFAVPRCYGMGIPIATKIELHVFVDASEVAFAAVCYLRIVAPGIEPAVSFVIGKTRCAPNKYLSVPRLELQAALLGVRLYNTVIDSHSLSITKTTFWSDSKTVLHWIKDDRRRYKSFVANRISEILDTTSAPQWNWIPTKLNVADDATRDIYPPKFCVNNRWINGPPWLRQNECLWPIQPEVIISNESDAELQPTKLTQLLASDNETFDFSRYSTYNRALRVMAWVLRFVNISKSKSYQPRSGELTAEEIRLAEIKLCCLAQRQVFSTEYSALSKKDKIEKTSPIYQLTPIMNEDGVIRLNGRIDNAPTLPIMTKSPIILPKNHPLTRLIVHHYHSICCHQNEELVICEIRRKFWVSNLRVIVRQIKRLCQVCKIRDAKPETPQMGQLPLDRLTPFIRPFSYTGLDYFGPVWVTVGRRREKRWIALFTCLTVRAIHLEIAADLSSDSCIICLRNFMNIRGRPTRIRSDNGTNFIGAKGELMSASTLYDQDSIKAELSMKGIEWMFNCPSNPSAGGCWERLVSSVKRVLKITLKEEAPRVETLRSFCLEAVNIINSRPLTHVPVSSIEDEPLTPNCFLLGTPSAIQSSGPTDEKLWCLKKQWRIANSLKNRFWRRWVREYLPTLTRRTKWFKQVTPLKKGDLVIICDEDVSRSQWIRGVIEAVITSKDGQVRQAEVRTNGRTLRRPASKLALLDVGKSSPEEIIYGGWNVGESGSLDNHTPKQEEEERRRQIV